MCRTLTLLFVLPLMLSSGLAWGQNAPPLLKLDFESDPIQSGWWRGALPHETPSAQWTDETSLSGSRSIVARTGWWASRRLEIKPLTYYVARFSAMVEGKGFWMIQYYDVAGTPLADHYTGVYPSEEWRNYEFCFRSRHDAATAEIRFHSVQAPLYVDDLSIAAISRDEVCQWADGIAESLPSLEFSKLPRPGAPLRRTMEKLAAGEKVRIVMLGDSIVNDVANSAFDVLVEREYPQAKVEVIASVRGSTGCTWYQQDGRVKEYVLDHQPDLVIIGGISHGFDAEAVRSVVRQIRAESNPDILLMSGAVCPVEFMEQNFIKYSKLPRAEALRRTAGYRPGLAQVAREERTAYLDLRSIWDAYLKQVDKHPMYLRRDLVHANDRGKQVLGRILTQYFAPKAAGK